MPMIGPTPKNGSREAVRNLVGGPGAELTKPAGRRPVLLLSRDAAYPILNKFIAAEITATIRHIPIEAPLGSAEGMSQPCVGNCDNLRTISKIHLVKKVSRISQRRVHEAKRAKANTGQFPAP